MEGNQGLLGELFRFCLGLAQQSDGLADGLDVLDFILGVAFFLL